MQIGGPDCEEGNPLCLVFNIFGIVMLLIFIIVA